MSVVGFFKNENNIFWEFALLSLGIHLMLFVYWPGLPRHAPRSSVVEIDLTKGVRTGHAGSDSKTSLPAAHAIKQSAKPREWTLPKKGETAPLDNVQHDPEGPPETQDEPGPPGAGFGNGSGEGLSDLASLSRLPQILNMGALRANLRRLYPEGERLRRQEGTVTINIHLDEHGHVVEVEVAGSAGKAFDEAAVKVAKLLRFSPAVMGAAKVPVKIQQSIEFKLE